MTDPHPPSQTLRERITNYLSNGGLFNRALLMDCEAALDAQEASSLALRQSMEDEAYLAERDYGVVLSKEHSDLRLQNQAIAAVLRKLLSEAAPEASPQPDLAREWFEKGFQAGLMSIDQFGEQHETAEEAYLDACRQEGA